MTDDPKRTGPRTGTRPDTKITHGGRRDKWLHGMVNVPVSRTSTVLFEDVAAMNAAYPPRDGWPSYGRNGTPTQWSLAEALTELEPGAAGTRLFASGATAVAFALMSVLDPGDEVLVADNVYQPTRTFCGRMLGRFGITARYYDPLASADEIEAMLSATTRAIFMESPGSLTFEVQDVPGICAMARARGITTLLDNTWATPLFFQALSHGVDLAILACTKYISGHADVMLGSVTATEPYWERLAKTALLFGQYVSPDDAYLAARGLRTLGVRLRRHEDSAIKIARWLQDQLQIAEVIHPAFKDCPGHAFWKRDFTGSSGLFSIVLKDADDAAANRFVESLELFGIGYSWGGFESLALPIHPEWARTVSRRPSSGAMVRLHIGLEDTDDLIADLEQGLRLIS